MRLIFIKHGETETNVKRKTPFTGDDTGLTAKGIKQIKQIVPVLRRNKIEKVYCSPEKRAEQSAKIVTDEMHLPLEILDDLRERNWGKWEVKPWDEIKGELDKMSLERRYNFVPPQGESWKQMEEGLKNVLKTIVSGKWKCVCIVTHAGALRGLMPILKNEELSISLRYDFENGSVTIFDYEDGKFKEIIVNDISHCKSI